MRKKYLADYELRSVQTPKGHKDEAVYKGNYFIPDMPEDELQKYKVSFIVLSLIMTALFIAMGLLNNDGTRVLYVALPYAILLLPVAFMFTGAVYFYRFKEKLTRQEYDQSYIRIKAYGMAVLYLSIACALGNLFVVLTGRTLTPGKDILFILMSAAIAFLAFLAVQIHKKVKFKTVSNTGTNH